MFKNVSVFLKIMSILQWIRMHYAFKVFITFPQISQYETRFG